MVKKQAALKQKNPSPEGLLAIAAFILPFVAWFIAALINPTGWASTNPGAILAIVYIPVIFWQVTLLILICIFAYLYYRKFNKKDVSILLMIISVILSAYIFQLTVSADESEFTG